MNQILSENPTGSTSPTNVGPGILYIFNHKNFDEYNKLCHDKRNQLAVRDGTECDVKALQLIFEYFDVQNILFNDLKLEEIEEKITEISTKNFSNNSCIIIAILTHGFSNNILAASDKMYNFNDIVLKIFTNKYMKAKPKIFLLQACRGDINILNFNARNLKTDGATLCTEQLPYYNCDEKYELRSATDEFVAYRDEKLGSPFIQIFCEFLYKLGYYKPISELFPLVMIEVQKVTGCSQMPEITTNAIKQYVFGDYCQGAKAVAAPLGINDGPSRTKIIDESEESSEERLPYRDYMPKVQTIYGSNFSEDTRKKEKKGSLLRNIKFLKKFADTEHSLVDDSGTVPTQEEADKWVKFCPTHIPHNVVVAGTDVDGEIMHVGRAYYKNDLLPGKVFLKRSLIGISFNFQELGLEQFEVLTGKCYSWVKADRPGSVPLNAVRGGWTEYGETLYIGRAYHDGSLTPGKIHLTENCLYIPFGGQEIQLRNYEVLVKSS